MIYSFGWKPINLREEVLEERFRKAGVGIKDLDRRFYSKGYTGGFTGLIRKYENLVNIAINSLETVLVESKDSSYSQRRKRIIARVSREFDKAIFSPGFLRQVTSPYNSSL